MITRECGKRPNRYPGIRKDTSYKSEKSANSSRSTSKVKGCSAETTFSAMSHDSAGVTHVMVFQSLHSEGMMRRALGRRVVIRILAFVTRILRIRDTGWGAFRILS